MKWRPTHSNMSFEMHQVTLQSTLGNRQRVLTQRIASLFSMRKDGYFISLNRTSGSNDRDDASSWLAVPLRLRTMYLTWEEFVGVVRSFREI